MFMSWHAHDPKCSTVKMFRSTASFFNRICNEIMFQKDTTDTLAKNADILMN